MFVCLISTAQDGRGNKQMLVAAELTGAGGDRVIKVDLIRRLVEKNGIWLHSGLPCGCPKINNAHRPA